MTWHEGLRIVTPVRAILDGIAVHAGDRFLDQAVRTGRGRGLLGLADLRTIETARTRARLAALEVQTAGAGLSTRSYAPPLQRLDGVEYGREHKGPMDGPDREEAGPQRSPASVCLAEWSGRDALRRD